MNFITAALSSPLGVGILIILAIIVIMSAIVSTWKKVPSDKAAVIVGIGKPKVVHGGGTIVIPGFQRIDTITLENIQINVSVTKTKTKLGVPINANGVLIVKVKAEDDAIVSAVQQFNCRTEEETKRAIQNIVMEVATGKLRELVSKRTVEELYDDREKLSTDVLEIVGTSLEGMGLELKSFTINDISDDDDYIASLGKEQIAKVKAQAAIAEAEASKEQAIKTAEAAKEQAIKTADARKQSKKAQLEAETEMAQAEKDKELKVLAYRQEQEKSQALADAAYKIQENVTSKDLMNTKMDADIAEQERLKEVAQAKVEAQIVEEQKKVELAQKKAEVAEAQLQETVVKPAEAARQRRQLEAEAKAFEELEQAEAEAKKTALEGEALAKVAETRGKAEAEAIRAKGTAEAESIRQKGLAEAEALDRKADALAKMDKAGQLQMVMDKMPEIARAISEPMGNIDSIMVYDGGEKDGAASVAGYTSRTYKIVADMMKEATGFDLMEVARANTFEGRTTQNLNLNGVVTKQDISPDAPAEK